MCRFAVPHLGSATDWARTARPYRDKIMGALEERFLPGLSDHIVTERMIDPRHFRDELNSYQGSAFSVEPILTQSAYFRPTTVPTRSPISTLSAPAPIRGRRFARRALVRGHCRSPDRGGQRSRVLSEPSRRQRKPDEFRREPRRLPQFAHRRSRARPLKTSQPAASISLRIPA